MCGLAGFVTKGGRPGQELEKVARSMVASLVHRGPDDAGVWIDPDSCIAMGHRRLAILDLSPAGHQPMFSSCGRYLIAFNGEIYNHLDLRRELGDLGLPPFSEYQGVSEGINGGRKYGSDTVGWLGHSDTETLLAGIATWGLEATLKRCVGMFAIALWDCLTKTLSLVRDRMGEKPLYYGWVGDGENSAFAFASELKALRAFPGFANPVCRQALAQYMRFLYVPAPRSIYQGIYKLEPGCILTLAGSPINQAPSNPLRPGQEYGSLRIDRWWALADVVGKGAGKEEPENVSLSKLELKLTQAVQDQSLADVPLGAFLSGGVDSSTIVALMQQQARASGAAPVQTFTIGFDEATFDESTNARAVAKHLGTRHHEMHVTAKMAQDVIPTLPWLYDEPFADSSQIPTHLVCKAARQHVTVALSGDAGDELFGGYNRYLWGPRIWNRLAHLPPVLRRALGAGLQSVSVPLWNTLSIPFLGKEDGVSRLGDKVHKLGDRLQHANKLNDLYRSLVSEWSDPSDLVRNTDGSAVIEPVNLLDDQLPLYGLEQDPLPMMYQDSMTYLPDDILCKVDRAAMACSLETRVPFLDHRVVEMAWRLPLHMKVRGNTGKWALRQLLYKHVPRELIERPKAGFAIPIGQWLRGPLREWAENLLSAQRLQTEGFLRPAPIRQAWAEHLCGKRDHTAKLWSVLMFQAWLEKNH
jgi:asparagine synthase (glutamine-hydrolysing)